MKSRRDRITATIRDGWIRDWNLQNKRSPHFVPFLKTQDIKSQGSKSRTPDFAEKGQDRDFYSTNERHFLYRIRFSNQFLWIKEQYPLLPLAKTISIAKALDVRHPTYPYTSNVHFIMTTDFYCRTIWGEEVAYSIKDLDELKKLNLPAGVDVGPDTCRSRTSRSSEREPADSLRDKSNITGGWLPSLTSSTAPSHEHSNYSVYLCPRAYYRGGPSRRRTRIVSRGSKGKKDRVVMLPR